MAAACAGRMSCRKKAKLNRAYQRAHEGQRKLHRNWLKGGVLHCDTGSTVGRKPHPEVDRANANNFFALVLISLPNRTVAALPEQHELKADQTCYSVAANKGMAGPLYASAGATPALLWIRDGTNLPLCLAASHPNNEGPTQVYGVIRRSANVPSGFLLHIQTVTSLLGAGA